MSKTPIGFKFVDLRSKYKFALLLFSVNEAGFIILSLYFSPFFLIGAFVTLFILGVYSANLKCPVCNKPVLYNQANIFGIQMYAYTLTIPSNCTQCGNPLELQ